jgi:hypothetical protein
VTERQYVIGAGLERLRMHIAIQRLGLQKDDRTLRTGSRLYKPRPSTSLCWLSDAVPSSMAETRRAVGDDVKHPVPQNALYNPGQTTVIWGRLRPERPRTVDDSILHGNACGDYWSPK